MERRNNPLSKLICFLNRMRFLGDFIAGLTSTDGLGACLGHHRYHGAGKLGAGDWVGAIKTKVPLVRCQRCYLRDRAGG